MENRHERRCHGCRGALIAATLAGLIVPVNALMQRMTNQQTGMRALANGQKLDQAPAIPLTPPAGNGVPRMPALPDPACVMQSHAISPACLPSPQDTNRP